METLKLRTIGKSTGIILPKKTLSRMNLKEGDRVHLTESPSGYLLTPYDPEFETQMTIAEEGMAQFRNTLRELAK